MIFRKAPTQTLFLFFVFVSALLFFPCPDSELGCCCGCLSHNDTLIINPYTLEASVPGLGYIKISGLEYLRAKLCLQLRRQHRIPCPKLLFMQGFAECQARIKRVSLRLRFSHVFHYWKVMMFLKVSAVPRLVSSSAATCREVIMHCLWWHPFRAVERILMSWIPPYDWRCGLELESHNHTTPN